MTKSLARQARTDQRSSAALLVAARAVLENQAFADAARAVLGVCKTSLDADAGLIALCPSSGAGLEIALLDPGHLGLDLDGAAGLPAPLRSLSARALEVGRTVFSNRLSRSRTKASPGDRCPALESALLAPIIIAGDVVGLIGLINRPGGFSAADSGLAEVFAEMTGRGPTHQRSYPEVPSPRTEKRG